MPVKRKESFIHWVKWNSNPGRMARRMVMRAGLMFLRLGRRCLRWSGGRCSWCGRNPGFQSVVSRRGLRCDECNDKGRGY